jgi:hypothetical protein
MPPDCCVPSRYKGTVSVLATPPHVTGGCLVRLYPVSACLVCSQIPILPGLYSLQGPDRGTRPQHSESDSHHGQRTLEPPRSTPKQLGRSARMPAAGTERPCRARQTCRGCKYSGKVRREARDHFPPPQRGSYRALDALGLRRGAGDFLRWGLRSDFLLWYSCSSLVPCLLPSGLRDHSAGFLGGRPVRVAQADRILPLALRGNPYPLGGGGFPPARGSSPGQQWPGLCLFSYRTI